MEGDYIKIHEWLLPASWIYGSVVGIRNWLFNIGLLKSQAYSVPIIAVGNITVGGAGKTPHVEHLVRLLQDKIKVAVLSRGYKRKTRGYQLADKDSTVETIGDEPFQMMKKFPNIFVATDKKRRRGIERLTSDDMTREVDAILLDDAYQHRYVKPGVNILLVDYHRLINEDRLLPAGRLRESARGKRRADIVIITKCPQNLKPMDYRVLTKTMELFPYQELYFTTLEYGTLQPLFPDEGKVPDSVGSSHILLLTGIASPKQMEQDVLDELKPLSMETLAFADHHYYKEKDVRRINEAFNELPEPRIIITTEKDAARLYSIEGLSDEVRKNIYALPIRIQFMLDQEESFNNKILSYVQKNSRNSILVKTKDEQKPKDSNHTGERPRRISFRDN